METAYAVIRQAICDRACIVARHRGSWITLCPHVLGWLQGEPYVVGTRLRSKPAPSPAPADDTLCLRLAELKSVRAWSGHWLPPPIAALPIQLTEIDVRADVPAR